MHAKVTENDIQTEPELYIYRNVTSRSCLVRSPQYNNLAIEELQIIYLDTTNNPDYMLYIPPTFK